MNRTKGPAHGPGMVGRAMSRLPAKSKLLWPLYLAKQLYRTEYTVSSQLLPAAFDGMKLVFVSDIHYGSFFDSERLSDLVTRVNAEDADAVLLGGDYGEDSKAALDMWSSLKPCFKAREGVYAVLGNHDVSEFSLIHPLMDAIEAAGGRAMGNRVIYLQRGGESLAICGTEECYFGNPDLPALERLSSDAPYRILLSHSPDILPDYEDGLNENENAFFQLFLCGHTHGGQVAIMGKPLLSSSVYGDRYTAGMKEERGACVIVSAGVGTSALPVRFGTKPEYNVITLRSKAMKP